MDDAVVINLPMLRTTRTDLAVILHCEIIKIAIRLLLDARVSLIIASSLLGKNISDGMLLLELIFTLTITGAHIEIKLIGVLAG